MEKVMKLIAPDYYTEFKCLADKCKHTCCAGWEIDIDKKTLKKYLRVKGELGEKLRSSISFDWNKTASFSLTEQKRCPFLSENGLCEIITTLGEDYLCGICTDHPRWRNIYGKTTEIGLGLACEEAGRIILSQKNKVGFVTLEEKKEKEKLSPFQRSLLERRERLLSLAQNREKPILERIEDIKSEFAVRLAEKSYAEWVKIFLSLERLDGEWDEMLLRAMESEIKPCAIDEVTCEQLLTYFIMRHILDSVDEYEFKGRVALCILFTQFIAETAKRTGAVELDGIVELCRMFSAEVEYSDQNLQSMVDRLTLF